jgi:hypothetical protein
VAEVMFRRNKKSKLKPTLTHKKEPKLEPVTPPTPALETWEVKFAIPSSLRHPEDDQWAGMHATINAS